MKIKPIIKIITLIILLIFIALIVIRTITDTHIPKKIIKSEEYTGNISLMRPHNEKYITKTIELNTNQINNIYDIISQYTYHREFTKTSIYGDTTIISLQLLSKNNEEDWNIFSFNIADNGDILISEKTEQEYKYYKIDFDPIILRKKNAKQLYNDLYELSIKEIIDPN